MTDRNAPEPRPATDLDAAPREPGPDPLRRDPSGPEPGADPAPEAPPSTYPSVEYKGAPLDAAKGPGLGCFWTQIVVLVVLVVLTPLSVQWGWPSAASAALLIAVLVLLLVSGQTIIFLLRLVAADRRAAGRRRPLASATRTVGELEDREGRDVPGEDGGHAGDAGPDAPSMRE